MKNLKLMINAKYTTLQDLSQLVGRVKMSFWDTFNVSKQNYFNYINSLRGKNLTIPGLKEALEKLGSYEREFEYLRSDARSERNSAVAESKLQQMISTINGKRDQYLEKLYKLQERERRLNQQIAKLEEAISRTEESLRHDHTKMQIVSGRRGNAWKGISERIKEKENKVRSMRERLVNLRVQVTNLY